MSNAPSLKQLTAALSDAGSAHHEYESNYLNGVRDEQWPGWYAAFVLGRLGEFTTPTQLTQWLETAPSDNNWAKDAAQFVLTQLNQNQQ